MNYKELMRRQLLERMYENLSDDDKRLFVQMTMQDRSHQEIMDALADLRKHQQTFGEDFASNIAGNALWCALTFLGSKLLKR